MSQAAALTAGEECRLCGQAFSAFASSNQGSACIPNNFVSNSMAVAIFRGELGVAIVRLKSGEWSAPCAIILENPTGTIQPGQDTVILFMSEQSVLSLVSRTRLILNTTHKFLAGPYGVQAKVADGVDMYAYVRFNGTFTPAELIQQAMSGWGLREDMTRHSRWHGLQVTWADVLMNKISVDRSSIGNTLYVVANMAAGGKSTGVIDMHGKKNYADLDKLVVRKGLDSEVVPPVQTRPSPGAEMVQSGGVGHVGQGMQQMGHTISQLQIQDQQAQQAQLQQNLLQLQLLQQQQLQQRPQNEYSGYAGAGLTLQQQQLMQHQLQNHQFTQQQQQAVDFMTPQQQMLLLQQQQQQQQSQLLVAQQQQQFQLAQQQQYQIQGMTSDGQSPAMIGNTVTTLMPTHGNNSSYTPQQLLVLQQQAQTPSMMQQAKEHQISLQIQKNLEDQIKAINEQARMVERQQEAIRNAINKK